MIIAVIWAGGVLVRMTDSRPDRGDMEGQYQLHYVEPTIQLVRIDSQKGRFDEKTLRETPDDGAQRAEQG